MSGAARGRRILGERYELDPSPLARGGMGEVYEGRDVRLERGIAVKFVRFPQGTDDREHAEMVRRFVRESRITAELQHPGVPAVFDAGSENGRPYLVMQRICGVSMADLTAEQEGLSVGWAAGIAAQVCSVLAAAHRASLVHRDLKPSNLMLEPDGSVKVLDFGLAVALDRADISQITNTGHTPGTPAYMAPEQLMVGRATPLSDLYALGCVLHEMLTGQRLFTASTPFAVASKQANERPSDVREKRANVPRQLSEVIEALLEKRPEQRPKDAVQVYERLIGFADGLEPIPGILHPPARPSPHRMYGIALSRVFGSVPGPDREPPAEQPTNPPVEQPAEQPEPADPPTRRADTAPTGRGDIERARSEVADLVGSSQYQQAAETLREAVAGASAAFGGTDPDVVGLRVEQANVLFEGGDFHQAGPLYAELAEELNRSPDSDQSLVFRCRLQYATCTALTGDTVRALELLRALLKDEVTAFGPDDHRPLELRRQMGLLELSTNQPEAARRTLGDLRSDLVRLHGSGHPTVSQIDDLLQDV